MRVLLQRLQPGRYAVALVGEQSVEETPLRVVRHRSTRMSKAWGRYSGSNVTETWWQVEFDGRTLLGVKHEWIAEQFGGNVAWEHTFGYYGEGFDTLRDARLKLEEVLGAREGGPGSETAPAHVCGDTRGGTEAC